MSMSLFCTIHIDVFFCIRVLLTRVGFSCRCEKSPTWMSHATHMNESCHTHEQRLQRRCGSWATALWKRRHPSMLTKNESSRTSRICDVTRLTYQCCNTHHHTATHCDTLQLVLVYTHVHNVSMCTHMYTRYRLCLKRRVHRYKNSQYSNRSEWGSWASTQIYLKPVERTLWSGTIPLTITLHHKSKIGTRWRETKTNLGKAEPMRIPDNPSDMQEEEGSCRMYI